MHVGSLRPEALPNRPAGQGNCVAVVDPRRQKWPSMQSPLQLGVLTPASFPNFPAAQKSHMVTEELAQVPGAHTSLRIRWFSSDT